MRLQRLEISGFKSFPDRAELSFESGVTAIVGPNGCGKSNVVDAISWVLGEQSAKSLRGDRMEDIIFSGSDARRPTGAAEVRLRLKGVPPAGIRREPHGLRQEVRAAAHASVATDLGPDASLAVVLDDVDEPLIVRDVEVARRLFRSGESEYLIDGQVCRLRDVQDLLMSSGFGVKAYAVIEQGKIGQILSARPTDRRQLIEEAAGVTKYRSKRRAAELKLEAAQQNLLRVEDIIFEIDKQRGALKRQAAKARRFRRLQEHLRRWEKILFARRYRLLAQAIQTARAQTEDARTREASAAAHVAGLEARLERLRLDLAEAERQATACREAAHARELGIGRLEQQVEFDRQQIQLHGAAAADIAEELRGLEARREPERLELERRRRASAQADEERDAAAARSLQDERDHTAASRRIQSLEADVEAARSDVFAAVNAATVLRHAIENAVAGRIRLRTELDKLDVEAADLKIEGDTVAADRERVSGTLQQTRTALEATWAALTDTASELGAARTQRDALVRNVREREQQLAALGARLTSLEELDAARAQYGDAARLVLSDPDAGIDQRGPVADHLEVERGYEQAVEAWLGDLLEHVIVPDHAQAAAGLAFVRQREAGRCGFVVLDASDGPEAAELEPPDGLAELGMVLRVSGPYAGAIRRAVGTAWLAPSFEAAVSAAGRVSGPVVTPEGDVVRGRSLVTGGGRTAARGILSTKREIKELRAGLAADQQSLNALAHEVEEVERRIAGLDVNLSRLGVRQHEQEKAILADELQLARFDQESERLARKTTLMATERRQAGDELTSLLAREEEARASLARLDSDQRAADERLAAAQRRLFEAREAVEAAGRRAAESKAVHAALVERAGALAADVGRLEEAAADLARRVVLRSADLEQTSAKADELRRGIEEAGRRLEEETAAFDRARADVRQAEEHVAGLHAEFQDRDATLREGRRALDGARATLNQLEIARATAEADLAHLAAACLDTVQATLDDIAAEVEDLEAQASATIQDAAADEEIEVEAPEAAPPASAGDGLFSASESPAPVRAGVSPEEAIADLRAKIERLGPVNMMAIEQFDELETRHGFLSGQQRDLVDAIATTGEAIKRIDRTTRERFKEAFESINLHFQEIFRTLFGGGRAGLVLLNEEDLLESGVDIIAQPPGKRLQNVQLLSGGEKALTAISLMFGIFKFRPSPFCLLDEIDAPLDDANIGRFVEMLRGMLDHTQFILITHNRRTMEIADRLYGVTMEEPGVSKLVSVQLN
jgi:chromosome segregation protein